MTRSRYTRGFLSVYDPMLRFTCPAVWRCSRQLMLDLYNRNLGRRHLDIGPGTGYFLDLCSFPVPEPCVVLADNSVAVLDKVSRRISRYHPDTWLGDAFHLDLKECRFESVAMLNLLHCLPGDMTDKSAIFDQLTELVNPGGRIFGCTLLGQGVRHTRAASMLLKQLNRDGMFNNADDSLDSLNTELAKRFASYQVRVYGSMALFEIGP